MANQKDNQEMRRVLSRTAARELTPKEMEHVSRGIHTNTVCTFDANTKQPDGDVGEC
jgi:hypothetical protein